MALVVYCYPLVCVLHSHLVTASCDKAAQPVEVFAFPSGLQALCLYCLSHCRCQIHPISLLVLDPSYKVSTDTHSPQVPAFRPVTKGFWYLLIECISLMCVIFCMEKVALYSSVYRSIINHLCQTKPKAPVTPKPSFERKLTCYYLPLRWLPLLLEAE